MDTAPSVPVAETSWRWRAALAVVLLAGLGGATLLYLRAAERPFTVDGLKVGGADVGGVAHGELRARLARIAATHLEQPIVLVLGPQVVRARRREVGLVVDVAAVEEAARRVGRSGDPLVDLEAWRAARRGQLDLPLPQSIDRPRALEFLVELKEALDRAPADAHLDLERHTVAAEQPGTLVEVYESLVRLEEAARSGQDRIELSAHAVAPRVRAADLVKVDIRTVIGTWETRYSTLKIDSDRTFNLKVGADKLNGHILKPHELFSFNEVVGPRTEREGYRVAPVIQGGELIDGLAGGMCQIASTLHAAAFFAGLEIVSSTPHSRPSAYIPLGLDSTVVYPSTDLKLRNRFDFPIVMHYQVHQGGVKVELLGKEKPYKTIFEREILQETAFGSQSGRRDAEAPKGQRLVLQEGYPGYRAIRRRYLVKRDQVLPRLGGAKEGAAAALERAHVAPLQAEKWTVHYPATTQIVAIGSGPPKLARKPPPPSHRIPPIPPSDKPIVRIVR